MTNFKVDQKVVCIRKEKWYCDSNKAMPLYRDLPTYNEICTIKSLDCRSSGYFTLDGYEHDFDGGELVFHPRDFRPIDYTTDAIPEILKNFSPKEEISDVPCKEVVN